MPDGSPQVAPVWAELEGDLILDGTGEGSKRRSVGASSSGALTPTSARWTASRTSTRADLPFRANPEQRR
jgi:hypothetical protein